jgi:putative transposase
MQYSFDLRRKLVEAWQNWDGTQAELAALLGISRSWVQKVLRRFEQTGDLAAPLHRHGPVSRLSRKRLAALVAAHPDATLAELGRRLRISASTVCRALRQMNLPRKKSRCTPASATRLGCEDCGRVGGRRAVVWTRAI